MKFNKEILKSDETPVLSTVIDILVNHFQYSINDVNSYNELTPQEKEIIPEEIWNEITLPGKDE